MISLAACVTGFILDFIFGDPAWIYHPVRIIGKGIELGERLLRRISGEKHLTAAGAVLWLMIAGLSFLFPLGILLLAIGLGKLDSRITPAMWVRRIAAAILMTAGIVLYSVARLQA